MQNSSKTVEVVGNYYMLIAYCTVWQQVVNTLAYHVFLPLLLIKQMYRPVGRDNKDHAPAIDCCICVRNVWVQIHPPSWILKIWNFWYSMSWVIGVDFVSLYKILCKSDKLFGSYSQKLYFPIWRLFAILDF